MNLFDILVGVLVHTFISSRTKAIATAPPLEPKEKLSPRKDRVPPAFSDESEPVTIGNKINDVFSPHEAYQSYDYVVIGGGTAGITVASRLAKSFYSVALIEAGWWYQFQSANVIPGAHALVTGTDPTVSAPHDWGFVARSVSSLNHRSLHYARGKCLGGSSALNAMIYQRPTVGAMQQWAVAVNDSSYTFDKVLPYFKKTIKFTPPKSSIRPLNATARYRLDAFERTGGPVQVSYSNYAMPFSSWMKTAIEQIGIRERSDFNSGSLMGYQYCASSIEPDNERRSSSDAFLRHKPAKLDVYSRSMAMKILFDSEKRAIGVQVAHKKTIKILSARKEVIVSAGAFQSPQILMVSGVGPAETLALHRIGVVANLPGVGQNMLDHPFFGPSYPVQVPTFSKFEKNSPYLIYQFLNYISRSRGPLTSPIADFLAWEKIPAEFRSGFSEKTEQELAKFSSDWPEAEYISGGVLLTNQSKHSIMPRLDRSRNHANMMGVLNTATSKGNVTIASNSVFNLPIINPNWLSTEADQQVAIAIFKRMRQSFQTENIQKILAGPEAYPGESVQTDEEILNYLKDNAVMLWHASCTCRMGVESDPMAVVDSGGRVLGGIQRLRVVDASAFPFLPPGHPQATVYMLAEKIADSIIHDDQNGFQRADDKQMKGESITGTKINWEKDFVLEKKPKSKSIFRSKEKVGPGWIVRGM